jgi:sialate O-acetylesterase
MPPVPVAALPAVFGDHMVLQAGKPIPVWGRTPHPSVLVEVQLLRAAGGAVVARATATSDAQGHFEVRLPSVAGSSAAHFLRLSAKGFLPVEFVDVLVGEVWVCSGQSNMQFNVGRGNNAEAEVAAATNALIRLFKVPNKTALAPQDDVAAEWHVCSPESAQGFSAVGYFFGRDLHAALDDHPPVGLIGTSWGGTPAQSWTSLPALQAGGFTNYTADYADVLAATNTSPEALAAYETKLAEHLASTKFPDRPLTDEILALADPGTVDAEWPTMEVPGGWEKTKGMESLNGAVWFRRDVTIPEAWAGRDLTLNLGAIDDCDKTFFNGELIGETDKTTSNHWMVARSYKVPGGLVKAGRAVVAVRVFDDYSGGGIMGTPQRLGPTDDITSAVALSGLWRYHVEYAVQEIKRPAAPGYVAPHPPSSLFNAMVNPLIPYAIAGAIWYQGESNAGNAGSALEYRTLFPAMINDWRTHWGQGDFPFLWCQLANFMRREEEPTDPPWARLREAQTLTLKLPASAQAVLIDVGEASDIHPRDKQTVGYRLALGALRVAYGRDIVHSGPMFKSLTPRDGTLVVHFEHTGAGLEARGGKLEGFAVAGADGLFHWADATIEGDTVVVRAAEVAAPVAVRYAWANNPAATLYNKNGLPAVPFDARLP